MEDFQPRVFKFKAWNSEARLLVKLGSIDFRKGVLFKKDHVLLQFTGMVDMHQEEIYEMDILMMREEKFLVRWHDQHNGWYLLSLPARVSVKPLHRETAITMKRLCNYFESEANKTEIG
jgi:hypothetical protein